MKNSPSNSEAVGHKKSGLLFYAFAYLAFLYVPVLVLPVFSFNNSEFIAFPLSGFTIRWYAELAADTAMQHALGNSLKVGIVTALLSTLLGLTAAKAVTHYRLRGAGAALGFISLPLFIPDIVLVSRCCCCSALPDCRCRWQPWCWAICWSACLLL